MHQWSLSKLQGVCTQQGVSTQRTTQDQDSRLRKGIRRPCLCLPSGACLWAWLLLGALTVPGAWSFLSEEQEELLVELHNHYRGQVSPSASAMLPLKWDASLKVVAEGYAAKCVWNHNPELEDTGENLFASTGTMDLREALEKWFLEHLDYDYHNNSCDEEKMCGHYTQMVWADTHRVGCAIHLCNNMEGLDWEKVSFLVCNYYPPGNYEDERPYVEGDWCSRCPEKLQKCENNLCVAETVDDDDDDDEDEDEDEVEDDTQVWTDDATEFTQQFGEENDEEGVVPPPATTDPVAQTIATIAGTTSAWELKDTPPQSTPAPGTLPPLVHTTLRVEEENRGEKVPEAEEKARETVRNPVGQEIKVGVETENRKEKVSSASVSSPSLLLACVSGILTLRL